METDNQLRDVIAALRKVNSALSVKDDKEELLKNQEFLTEIYLNLTNMFEGFDKIYQFVKFDQKEFDMLVSSTISSLDRLSEF